MKDEIILEPRDAIYNAGLYGLYRLLIDACEGDIETEERIRNCSAGLLVPTKLLEGLETRWVDRAIKLFGKDCAYTRLVEQYDELNFSRDGIEDNAVITLKKALKDRLDKASYKSAYEIIRDKGDTFDAPTAFKAIKDLNGREFIERAEPVIEYLKRNRRTFLMKEIAYTVINSYWSDRAFLSRTKNKKDIELCIKEDMIEPVKEWLDETKKQTGSCLMCGSGISGKFSVPMTWICDMGVDDARKKSNFYDFIPDAYLCPLCALVYTCLPFGFTVVGGDGMFINDSSSFEAIRSVNARFTRKTAEMEDTMQVEDSGSYGRFWHLRRRAYEALCDNENAEQRESAVQIIQRRKQGDSAIYAVEQLSYEKVYVLKSCAAEFRRLTEVNVKLSDKNFVNLFSKAADNLMNGQSQHSLISSIMRQYLGAGTQMRGVWDLIRIEICFEEARKRIIKKEETMDFSYRVYKKASAYSAKAAAMHDRLSTAEEGTPSEREKKVSNKLRGYIYRLLNQLNTKDYQGFADSVARMHLSVGEDFPTEMLMEMMISEDKFQTYGMAYIYGLSNGNVNTNNTYKSEEENK